MLGGGGVNDAQHGRHAHKCSKIFSRTGGPIFTNFVGLYRIW